MATKIQPTIEDLTSHPFPGSQQLADHAADLKRRAAEREGKRDLLERCLDAKFAAKCESEKPNYRWTVEAKWTGPDRDAGDRMTKISSKQTVIAQNEADAWAMFCDEIGHYPSIKMAKPKFTRGRQVSVAELVNQTVEDKEELPQKTIGRKPRPKVFS